MPELNYLQFQPIDPQSDADEIPATNQMQSQSQINLNEPVDEEGLEQFWSQVEDDIQKDPEWFTFSDQ